MRAYHFAGSELLIEYHQNHTMVTVVMMVALMSVVMFLVTVPVVHDDPSFVQKGTKIYHEANWATSQNTADLLW